MLFGGATFSGAAFADVPPNVPTATAPTWFLGSYPDRVVGTVLTLGVLVAPLLPPAAVTPTQFQGRYPDQVRAGTSAPSTTFTEPILPPPVPFVAAYFPATIDRRPVPHLVGWTAPLLPPTPTVPTYFPLVVAPASLTTPRPTLSPAWSGPVLPQANELPPFGWWPDYPTTLPVVVYTADFVGVFTGDLVTPPRFRRTLQLRIGSRTEPEKL